MKKLLLIALLIVGCEKKEEGCTDSNAINFNPNATVTDNTCKYSAYGGYPDFETICGMDEYNYPTENIGDGICGLCLGQIEYDLNEGISTGGIGLSPPAQFALGHAYPNPFNPKTIMDLAVPESANISILVSNTLYEIIDTLQNGYMDAATYRITWDATSFPDGYYRVIADFGSIQCFRNIHKKPLP